jgi:hypothetical protein
MSTPNIPLLREVATWIREQIEYAPSPYSRATKARVEQEQAPDLIWDQAEWAEEVFGAECKTACCVAGYVVLTDPAVSKHRTLESGVVVYKSDDEDTLPYRMFSDHAQERLGLDAIQATRLFNAGNGSGRVLELLSEYAGEEL